jgi:hypothetical protein
MSKKNITKKIEVELKNKKTFNIFDKIVYPYTEFTTSHFLSVYDINNVPQFYEWISNNINNNNILTVNRIINAFIDQYYDTVFIVNDTIVLFVKKYLDYLINENLFYIHINYVNYTKDAKGNVKCNFIDKYENLYKEYEHVKNRKKFFVKEISENITNHIDYEDLTNSYFNDFFHIEYIDGKRVIGKIHDYLMIKFSEIISKYILKQTEMKNV